MLYLELGNHWELETIIESGVFCFLLYLDIFYLFLIIILDMFRLFSLLIIVSKLGFLQWSLYDFCTFFKPTKTKTKKKKIVFGHSQTRLATYRSKSALQPVRTAHAHRLLPACEGRRRHTVASASSGEQNSNLPPVNTGDKKKEARRPPDALSRQTPPWNAPTSGNFLWVSCQRYWGGETLRAYFRILSWAGWAHGCRKCQRYSLKEISPWAL